MDYLTKAKEIFSNDIFASETTGIEILAAEPGYAKCRLEIEKKHLNALNSVMGGVIFTMADYAFAIAANIGGDIVVTINSQISYLGSAKGKELYADARPVKVGRSTCVYNIDIRDELDTQVACVSVTGFVKSKQ